MFSAFGWVLFGFAIWGLCIAMHAVQKRFAPEWNSNEPGQNWWDFLWGESTEDQNKRRDRQRANSSEQQIAELAY